jgi:hypothetical protein
VSSIFSRSAVVCALALTFGCGGGTGGGPATPTAPSPSTPASPASPVAGVPAPPPGCTAWPASLGDIFSRLPLPENLCLLRETSPLASEYRPAGRKVIYRNPSPAGGEIHSIVHELDHAHQHRAILNAGMPDISVMDEGDWLQSNWMRTPEGIEYLQAAGYAYLGPSASCTRSVQPGCWRQDPASAEMGFTLSSYGNPMEDNAEFCAIWQNLANLPMWSRSEVARLAPKRAAWAQKYLQ